MAIKSAVVTIGTTPTLISFAGADGRDGHTVCIQNISTTVDFYIGGSDVSDSNGYHLNTTENLYITLLPGNSLYGRAGSGTKDLAFFVQDL